jgi:hypothetical protein
MTLNFYRPIPAETNIHRGQRFLAVVEEDGRTLVRTIDHIRYCVLELTPGGVWIIAPTATANEAHHPDIGPFTTAEQAVAQLKLLGS